MNSRLHRLERQVFYYRTHLISPFKAIKYLLILIKVQILKYLTNFMIHSTVTITQVFTKK